MSKKMKQSKLTENKEVKFSNSIEILCDMLNKTNQLINEYHNVDSHLIVHLNQIRLLILKLNNFLK